MRRLARLVWPRTLLFVGFVCSTLVGAESPVLHEEIPPDADEDGRYQAAEADGLPAAIETKSGKIDAPQTRRPDRALPDVYTEQGTDSINSAFQIDNETTAPTSVHYDEPFLPAIAPFKRLYAYDAISPALALTVKKKQLEPVAIGGTNNHDEDDQFYADLLVDLAPGVPTRIPSVGPGARILSLRSEFPVQILRDGADNWFALASVQRRARLVMRLAILRRTFGSAFADRSFAQLAGVAAHLPDPDLEHAVREVAEKIGILPTQRPRQVLDQLVDYFRRFTPSSALPSAFSGLSLYRELSLSQKGVCRHRAYAFMITANGLGIPTRFISNEAHAWVEVYDGEIWHRIDLGGAAATMDFEQNAETHQHQPPPRSVLLAPRCRERSRHAGACIEAQRCQR